MFSTKTIAEFTRTGFSPLDQRRAARPQAQCDRCAEQYPPGADEQVLTESGRRMKQRRGGMPARSLPAGPRNRTPRLR